MIQKTSQPITFEAFFTASKQGKTGLTVTVDVYGPSGSLVVTSGAATEIGGGFYRYTLAGASTGTGGAYRAVFKSTDTSVDLQHVPSLWAVGVAGVDNLDATVGSRLATSGYTAPDNASALAAKTAAQSVDGKLTTARAANLDTSLSDINLVVNQANSAATAVNVRLTPARATKLDNLDAAVSSRLATSGYTAPDNTQIASTYSLVAETSGMAVDTNDLIRYQVLSNLPYQSAITAAVQIDADLSTGGVAIAYSAGIGQFLNYVGAGSRVLARGAFYEATGYTVDEDTGAYLVYLSPAPTGGAADWSNIPLRIEPPSPLSPLLSHLDNLDNLDNLDVPVSSRLAADDYVPGAGGGGSGGGSSVRLIQGPLHLYSDQQGSDGTVEVTAGDAVTLALYLRDANNEPIPYSSGMLTARLSDAFGNVVTANVPVTEINPEHGIAQVSFAFQQRGRFRLSVKRTAGSSDIVSFGPLQIHVCGAS